MPRLDMQQAYDLLGTDSAYRVVIMGTLPNEFENFRDCEGIYFWEQNPGRALLYAEESAAGKQKNKVQIKTPFVMGAIIELGNCLNLLEPVSIQIVKDAHDAL